MIHKIVIEISSIAGQDAVGPDLEPFEWTHRLDLDPDGRFSILWRPDEHRITMQLEVRKALENAFIVFSKAETGLSAFSNKGGAIRV